MPTAPAPGISWDNGLHLHPGSGDAMLEIGGMLQLDDRAFAGPAVTQGVPYFTLRRGRLVLIGTGFKRWGFRIMGESQEGESMVLRDAYVDFKINKGVRIQAGKFKSPIGLERLREARYLVLAERSLATDLIPDRDFGIQVQGKILGDRVSYRGGIFRGVPDGGSTENSSSHGADAEFRVFAHPFGNKGAPVLRGLGLGIGASAGREDGSLPRFGTAGLARFFGYRPGAVADGERTRISPQADYYWRRVGVMAEYALSAQDVRLGSATGRVANTAWQTTASYVVTGESASSSGITPVHSFDPANHHWGAFEIAGRFNSLRIDPRAYPLLADPQTAARKASGYQLGFNWYPQKYLKVVFNYAQTRFVAGALSGNRPTEHVFIFRIQLSAY